MGQAIKAGSVYFAVVFALGFVFGTVRTLALAPLTGELAAVALELPVMLTASWFACGWSLRRHRVSAAIPARIAMATTAFGLLMGAEILVSTQLAGRSMAQHLALYGTAPALLGLSAQLTFAAFPIVHSRGTGNS
jgi:cytochrome c oxidase assembly factor CtaG